MIPRPITLACALAAGAALASAQQPPTFRTGTSAVHVDVIVRDGAAPVRGLGKDDFQVFDDGIPQEIDELLAEQVPIDLTMLVDASGSTMRAIESFRASAAQVSAMLRGEDRVRVTAFATGMAELSPLAPRLAPGVFTALPAGATSLNDALVLSLARTRVPGRRHLVVAYTDGADTSSVLETVMVARVARRADSVLYIVFDRDDRHPVPPDALRMLREAADATGGAVLESSRDAAAMLREVFDEVREAYVLRYTPRDVPAGGWHPISVRVRGPGAERYTVRARSGYFAGAR
jgi:Ca-activated chloride channel homolog